MNSFNGFTIVKSRDYKVYKNVLMTLKTRKFKRKQMVKQFSHWGNVISDGDIIQDGNSRQIYMNPRTYSKFVSAVEKRNENQA